MSRCRRFGVVAVLASAWTAIASAADAPVDNAMGRDQSGAALDNPLARHSLASLSATRERPLFAPSRRPPSPPPVVPRSVQAAPPAPPPTIVVLGVISDDDGPRAFVRAGGNNKVVRAQLGDEIEGWTVTAIEPRRLELSHDDRSASFALFVSAAKGQPGRPPATPALAARNRSQELLADRSQRRR